MKNFIEQLSSIIAQTEMSSKDGLTYLPASVAMSLAGRPSVTFVDFENDLPYQECFNGALVAVDLEIAGLSQKQRMYLHVMDQKNDPKKLTETKVDDINTARQRCLVKALATVYGTGMSVFLNHAGDGVKAAKMLGIQPDTDLATVEPIVAKFREGDTPYIEWNVGVAACRITDPLFFWEVVQYSGKPYREVLGGVQVDVSTTYKGKELTMSLPLLDGAFNVIPKDKVTTADWNKTVMRALTKCIAYNSGYGLSVYSEVSPTADDKKNGSSKQTATPPASKQTATPPASKQTATPPAQEKPVEATPPAAAEQASASAAADPAPAAAPAAAVAEAPVLSESTQAAVARFKEVIRNRDENKGVPAVLVLFESLTVSDKFAAEDKPACFATLISALATRAEGQDAITHVDNLVAYGAAKHVPEVDRDVIFGRILRNYLDACLAVGDSALAAAPATLISAGVVPDMAEMVRLAMDEGVLPETLDLIAVLQDTVAA